MSHTSQIETDIVELLSGETELHVVEITDAINQHPLLVERACIRLCERGALTSTYRGFYELDDAST